MITFDSFKVDLVSDDWRFYKQEGPMRMWATPSQDVMQQRMIKVTSYDLPMNYPNRAKLRSYFEDMAKQNNDSVLIAADTFTVRGVEGFSTMYKFKNPRNTMGHRVMGTIMFTFDGFCCAFHFQSDEQGTTGEREASIYMLLKAQDKLPPDPVEAEKQPPRAFKTMDEYFEMVKARPALPHFSDDEQYDTAFPNHPLSRVRYHMKHMLQTIDFDDEIKQSKPYHGPEWISEQ